jgi:5-(carboxyamino)imidazole ribonucleotide mutase
MSAHRTPGDVAEYARGAAGRGLRVLIAGAGGAAHLAGVVAAWTVLPVIGVPIESRSLRGLDSLLSMVQMPAGVPVGSVGIGAGRNAGLLAVQILGVGDEGLRGRYGEFKARLAEESRGKDAKLRGDCFFMGGRFCWGGRGRQGFWWLEKCFLNETKRGGVSSYESE